MAMEKGLYSAPEGLDALDENEPDIEIEIAGELKTYAAGDVFSLAYEELHAESYGPQGVKYLASRKNEIKGAI